MCGGLKRLAITPLEVHTVSILMRLSTRITYVCNVLTKVGTLFGLRFHK